MSSLREYTWRRGSESEDSTCCPVQDAALLAYNQKHETQEEEATCPVTEDAIKAYLQKIEREINQNVTKLLYTLQNNLASMETPCSCVDCMKEIWESK